MPEINTNYTFTNETFRINSDVYFTVDTTVINGHRICKLKSLTIFYYEQIYTINSENRSIYEYFIMHGLKSIPSIELINYLNRYINQENLFDVYSDDFNQINIK